MNIEHIPVADLLFRGALLTFFVWAFVKATEKPKKS